jgi:3-oxoacyl-(acyl-carrier-protein) synthase
MNAVRRRVAITGIGLVTPVGNDVATTWESLLAGRSGGATITLFDASGFPVRIAAEVKNFEAGELAGERKLLKYADRSHRFALTAAEQAFRDARLRPTPETAKRWGCAVGAGMMTSEYVDLAATHAHSAADGELHADRLLADPAANDPRVFCRSQATTGISLLTRRFGIEGYATSVHTACASGGQAIGTALKLIRRGAVDRALAGGFDSMISPVGLAGFCLLSAVSPDNATPQRASRPFDLTRNGFLLGGGRLPALEAGRQRETRRASTRAGGDGSSLSSYRIPTRRRTARADQSMRARWRMRRDAGGLDYLNAHGTSTPMNDKSESAATHAVFGEGVHRVGVSSTKSSMGHLIAAAGAVEVAVCALAMHRGEMPVNANLVERDPDCDLNIVTGAPRRQRIRMAMSNSFGFGGSNSCVILRNPEEVDGLAGAPP